MKQKLTPAAATTTAPAAVRSRPTAVEPTATAAPVTEKKPFQSRFLPNHQTPAATTTPAAAPTADKKDETETSSEEETSEEETEEEEEDEEEEQQVSAAKTIAAAKAASVVAKPDVSSVLSRPSSVRDTDRRSSRDESVRGGGYSSPSSYNRSYEREPSPSKYTPRTRPAATRETYEEPKYGSSTG